MHTVQRLCGESIKESKFKVLCECGALASPTLPGSPSPDLLPLRLALMLPESTRNLHTFVPSPLWILLPGSPFPLLGKLLLDRQSPMQISPCL